MSQPEPLADVHSSEKDSFWLRPLLRLARRVGSFMLVGGVATGVQYLLLVVLIEWMGVFAVVASATAYGVAAVVSYLLNFYMTFQGRAGHRQALPRFMVVVAVGLGVNTLSFTLLLIFFPYLVAQLGATLVTLVSNYLLHQRWIYHSRV
ncbi:GtrA family protein [Microbulbifer sp. Q7]|uniref:GtrA family protein n=1 Tax=Microbulbifer sp. Q7 TaxID=1785091 RepID=UPI00082F7829|nr:GtrA family protein [Microbulbifer sp. Q7]